MCVMVVVMMVINSETSNASALLSLLSRTEERLAYHGMFDAGINPSLLCVYAYLDSIVHTSAVDRKPVCHMISVRLHRTS